MSLVEKLSKIQNRKDLSSFIVALREDLISNPDDWENPDLSSFLEAMAAWVSDMDGYYQNMGISFDERPSWRTIADILYASRIYE